MYVEGFFARDFRSLEDVTIPFKPGLNVLVGKNNSGKSNIICALDYLLGETWPTYRNIENRDFFKADSNSDPATAFVIGVALAGSDLNSELLSPIKRKVNVLQLKDKPNFKDIDLCLSISSQTVGSGIWHTYSDLGNLLIKAKVVVIFLAVQRDAKRGERVFNLVFKDSSGWWCVPVFAGELRDALLTTAYVPSFRDPGNQLRINQYNWYGKLIKRFYDSRNEKQKGDLADLQSKQAGILKDIFKDATDALQDGLKDAVFHNRISFVPAANTRDDEHKSITLFVDDGLDAPFYEKGSGIQSALVMGLFSVYCDCFHKSSTLLLAEEPELYLHPQARRSIEGKLVEFVEKGKTIDEAGKEHYKRQVIISTHASEFLRSVPMTNVTLVRRPVGDTATTEKQSKEVLPRTHQIMQTKNAEMLFADHVILVEGGEEYLLPPLADLLFKTHNWLDLYNFSVVRVNGKTNFINYVRVLDDFGIKWTLLADLDFISEGIANFSSCLSAENQKKLGQLQEVLKKTVDQPKGKTVKEDLFSPETRDWCSIYGSVDEALRDLATGQEVAPDKLEKITRLWDQLRDRVTKPNYELFLAEDKNVKDLEEVLKALREKNIHVLSKGELEYYFSAESMTLGQTKDLRCLEVGTELKECKSIDDASKWIVVDEFTNVLSALQGYISKT